MFLNSFAVCFFCSFQQHPPPNMCKSQTKKQKKSKTVSSFNPKNLLIIFLLIEENEKQAFAF